MSTVKEIEAAISKLPLEEMQVIRDWLDEYIEDQLELTDEVKAKIEEGRRDIQEGRFRTRQPE